MSSAVSTTILRLARTSARAANLVALVVMVFCAVAAFGAPPARASTNAFYGDVTLVTTVQIDKLTHPLEITLAALRSQEGPDSPIAFSLTWSWQSDGSSWFPSWALSLVSEAGLLAGGKTSAVVSSIGPTQGHEYEVTLSYSSSLGALAIRVSDRTQGRVVYADTVAVESYGGALYANLDDVTGFVRPGYVPVGTTWSPGTVEPGAAFVPLSIFETRGEAAAIRLRTPPPFPPGEFQITLMHDGGSLEIATVTPTAFETLIPLPLSEAPLGESLVRVDYVQDGKTLFTEARPIVVGRINVWVEPPVVMREQGRIGVPVRLASAEPVEDEIHVELVARFEKLVWDGQLLQFDYEAVSREQVFAGPVDLSTGEARFTATMPLPSEEGNYRVRFQPALRPNVASYVNGAERLFSTYQPAYLAAGFSAGFSTGKPYTFAVFPDTQYYSARHPHVFTRMTDWIAQNASEYNIAAVLHVGDITDDNSPAQWENAQRSMSLLQGVVPYVLAIGNHDMIGSKGVYGRDDSRVNSYFPVEAAERYSNLGGTLVPGRIENSYSLVEVAGDKYLVISLEFGPPDEALAWANEVVAAHPDHWVIYLTHSYLSPNGGLSSSPRSYPIAQNPETTVNTAPDIWEKLIRRHANSMLVVSGHVTPEVPTVPYRIARANGGQWVYQLLFDFQWEKPYDGNGWIGLLTFHPNEMLEVRLYSPLLDEWGEYRDPQGFTSRMWIDLRQGRVIEHDAHDHDAQDAVEAAAS